VRKPRDANQNGFNSPPVRRRSSRQNNRTEQDEKREGCNLVLPERRDDYDGRLFVCGDQSGRTLEAPD